MKGILHAFKKLWAKAYIAKSRGVQQPMMAYGDLALAQAKVSNLGAARLATKGNVDQALDMAKPETEPAAKAVMLPHIAGAVLKAG